MRRLTSSLKHVFVFFIMMQSLFPTFVFACTRALWKNDQAVVVGRTMDWSGDMKSNLWVYPRGIERDGLALVNSMSWISKYGSIVTTAYDAISTDGMNEKGLGVHLFWLEESDYGQRQDNLPAISVLMWEQYYLDNFATVEEAVRFTQSTQFQIEKFELDQAMTVHLILDDSTGDSAIIEYLDGQVHIYHDHHYTVATNSPSYDKQLINLQSYKGYGGDKPLPGTTDSTDRFVRAAFYSDRLPTPMNSRDAIMKILSVTNNTAMPYGASTAERPEPSETIWHTALDLSHHIYYFISTNTHNLIWANLDKFNLAAGAPILKLDLVNSPHLVGDVTNQFKSGMEMKPPRSISIPKFHP